jgi:hypothetical protein
MTMATDIVLFWAEATCSSEYLTLEHWSSIWGKRSNLRVYTKASYINQNETQEPFKPSTHEDSSPILGAGMPEASSVTSLTGQNHINN